MNRMTPLEIQRASFPSRWKGWIPTRCAQRCRNWPSRSKTMHASGASLKAQVARLSGEVEEYCHRTNALNEVLVAAQHTAEAMIGRAEAEAQRIVSEAQALADRVIDDAIHRAENLEFIISQLRSRRRAARAEVQKVIELLQGSCATTRQPRSARHRHRRWRHAPRVREGKAS